MVKKLMYQQIQRLKNQGYSKKQISKELNIDRKTVKKYFQMSDSDFNNYRISMQFRIKFLDNYRDEILEIYEKNNNRRLNMASVYDYLEEKHGTLNIGEKSFRNYIDFLIITNRLAINESVRFFQKVPELPFGRQMQLDFGQHRCKSGLRLYIFAAILSASRCKYIAFQDKPFSTANVISHLLDCFDFYGGMPEEIAIDQDRLMVVSENKGDILYTKDFDYFKEEMGFSMYVCRKADPQSKGKVENLIKYVKYNFFNTRDFQNADDANKSLFEWLKRRANGKISQATKRIPAEDIILEREHLLPVRNSIFRKNSFTGREERTVSDKAYVMANANSYQLPARYRKKTVEIFVTRFKLFVFDINSNEQIAEYNLSPLNGQKITNRVHDRRRETKIEDLKKTVFGLFKNSDKWKRFAKTNFITYHRYVRDQVSNALKHFKDRDINACILSRALTYCLENKTYSFANLNDTYNYFLNDEQLKAGNTPDKENIFKLLQENTPQLDIQTRSIDEYSRILKEASR
jgi:transposase